MVFIYRYSGELVARVADKQTGLSNSSIPNSDAFYEPGILGTHCSEDEENPSPPQSPPPLHTHKIKPPENKKRGDEKTIGSGSEMEVEKKKVKKEKVSMLQITV